MNSPSSVVEDRLAKRASLLEEGVTLYPAHAIERTHSLQELRASYGSTPPDTILSEEVVVAGRVMFTRSSGKIAFATLQEGEGTRLQLMLTAQELGLPMAADEDYWLEHSEEGLEWDAQVVKFGKQAIKRFMNSVDLGDFIWARGLVATSIKGELSVRVQEWGFVSKATSPLPFLHAELSDEARVRQPYAHLIQSQEARDLIRARSRIVRTVRRSFEDWDFLEVETPILQPVHGGAQARPFKTHVNALADEFSLRIALELDMKLMLIGGLEKIFQMGAVFRNEGIDSNHSPEFTLLEWYEAYGDMYSVAAQTEELFRRVCYTVTAGQELEVAEGVTIDFAQPFRWLSVYDGVSDAVGATITSGTTTETLQSLASEHGVSGKAEWPAGKWVMELCSELVEPNLIQPTFLHDWPAEAQPLARRNDEDPARILAWDLIVNGQELATGFTELADPVLQRSILEEQSRLAANGDPEAMNLNEAFLRGMAIGMPAAGGGGMGIDRLIALFTRSTVRGVRFFPLLKRID